MHAQKYSSTVLDECRLLIKTTVFIEHRSVKEILLHCLYNSWKIFSLLYSPSTVNSLCCDAAYDTCLVHPILTNTHAVNPTVECSVGYPVRPVTKNVFLPTIRGEYLIV